MKGGQAEQTDRGLRFRPGKRIVASQVALSLVLLVVAGLFLHSMLKLATLDIGFDRSNVLLVNSDLKLTGVPPEQYLAVHDEIETRLRSLPGVVSVGRSVLTPVSNFEWDQLILVDSPTTPKGDDAETFLNFVSPGYFPTLRTPLLEGRNFAATDTKTSAPVAIVNEIFARKFFPGISSVGKYIRTDWGLSKTTPPIQIVGVVKDSKYESLREKPISQAFFPADQILDNEQYANFEIRTGERPSALISLVQDSVAQVDKTIPLDFSSLSQQVDDSLIQERLLATLSAFFGALALLLAMIGLYGALSYLVTQRRTEFGIRLAVGASRLHPPPRPPRRRHRPRRWQRRRHRHLPGHHRPPPKTPFRSDSPRSVDDAILRSYPGCSRARRFLPPSPPRDVHRPHASPEV